MATLVGRATRGTLQLHDTWGEGRRTTLRWFARGTRRLARGRWGIGAGPCSWTLGHSTHMAVAPCGTVRIPGARARRPSIDGRRRLLRDRPEAASPET